MIPDYEGLYSSYVGKFKITQNGRQAIGLCQFHEDPLPSVAKLIKEVKILLPTKNELSSSNDLNCCYCVGIGYLPYLYEPNDFTPRWHTKMWVCSCPRGQAISGIPRYFDRYEKLQFEEKKKQYPVYQDTHNCYYQMLFYHCV